MKLLFGPGVDFDARTSHWETATVPPGFTPTIIPPARNVASRIGKGEQDSFSGIAGKSHCAGLPGLAPTHPGCSCGRPRKTKQNPRPPLGMGDGFPHGFHADVIALNHVCPPWFELMTRTPWIPLPEMDIAHPRGARAARGSWTALRRQSRTPLPGVRQKNHRPRLAGRGSAPM